MQEDIEIWKDIPEYGDYQISTLAQVKSLKFGKERILKPAPNHKGYLAVILCKNGKQNNFQVHQLVAIAFLGHKPCGMELVVNHINLNKLDNRAINLEIVTNRENCNRKHLSSSSNYIGVYWHKKAKKWVARIRINSKLKHLGSFINEYDAHLAYQNALSQLND